MMHPRRLARIAGGLYLGVAVFSVFAILIVRPKVYVSGDATATALNMAANETMVRMGVVADLIQATLVVMVGMALYWLLRHVHAGVAGSMVIFIAIAASMMCLANAFQLASLRVATTGSYEASMGADGAENLVLLLMDLQHDGFLLAQIFFALWLVPMGYLVYQSRMFPPALGIALYVGAAAYLVDLFLRILVPDLGENTTGYLSVLPAIAEVWMVGYLLIVGVRNRNPEMHTTGAS